MFVLGADTLGTIAFYPVKSDMASNVEVCSTQVCMNIIYVLILTETIACLLLFFFFLCFFFLGGGFFFWFFFFLGFGILSQRLQVRFETQPMQYLTLQRMIESEIQEGTQRKGDSCTNGLLWIKR